MVSLVALKKRGSRNKMYCVYFSVVFVLTSLFCVSTAFSEQSDTRHLQSAPTPPHAGVVGTLPTPIPAPSSQDQTPKAMEPGNDEKPHEMEQRGIIIENKPASQLKR